MRDGRQLLKSLATSGALLLALSGCKSKSEAVQAENSAPFMSAVSGAPPAVALSAQDQAPAPEKTGGFDGQKAYAHVVKQVSFGPHPAGSAANASVQDYIVSELKSYGCGVDVEPFSADTPVGSLSMKNIVAKVPGQQNGIILLGTHYDTKLLANFVGADDGGSSTGVMLELARLLCPQHGKYAVWIVFFDGEEATKTWTATDSVYGSREMAAHLAATGELKDVKVFLLADIVGGKTPHFRRDSDSSAPVVDTVWSAGKKLGYSAIFLDESTAVDDDHEPFMKRNVPSADIIDFDTVNDVPYWHTPGDSLDKISAKTLAIVGHVFLETVAELQTKPFNFARSHGTSASKSHLK